MLSNAYFLAKVRFDTAENEPCKVCRIPSPCGPMQVTVVVLFSGILSVRPSLRLRKRPVQADDEHGIWHLNGQTLEGSFSAVSKRTFARKYAFDSIFQALQDLHPFALLQSQNFRKKMVKLFEKTAIFVKFQQKNCKCRKICEILSNFKNFSLRIW